MIKLSYGTNGINDIPLFDAINFIESVGYDGVELCFHKEQFNPFTLSDSNLEDIKNFFSRKKIKPVAISTGTTFLLSDKSSHGPSLFEENAEERDRRIKLIRRGIYIAKKLNVPVVTFPSGFSDGNDDANKDKLANSVKECLNEGMGSSVLTVEPEPGMLIEGLFDGLDLIKKVNDPRFRLHIDIGHAYCASDSYLNDIGLALQNSSYIHLADIKSGYNLEFTDVKNLKSCDLSFFSKKEHGRLSYIIDNDAYFFQDDDYQIYFVPGVYNPLEEDINYFTDKGITPKIVNLQEISGLTLSDDLERETRAYIDTLPKENELRTRSLFSVLNFLRTGLLNSGKVYINKPFGYSKRGKVHYHELPGKGEIDFKGVFKVLINNSYKNYVNVELYNHVDVSREVIPYCYKYITGIINDLIKEKRV